MRHFVILFLIAFHVTHLQASLSVAEDSINGANDLELGAIETSDVDQYEGELELKSEGLRSSSKHYGNTSRNATHP